MADNGDVSIEILHQWLGERGVRLHLTDPGEVRCERIPLGFTVSGGTGDGLLKLEFARPPEGVLTLGEASWKEGGWVEIAMAESLALPTPAALVLSGGALAIAGERDWRAVEIRLGAGGASMDIPLPPQSEGRLWLTFGDSVDALGALAEAMMDGVETAGPPRGPLFGWMSWDELRFDLTEGDVVENAVVLTERLGGEGSIVLLDDGWQRAAGDWEPHETFSHGMLWLTDRIHRLGAKAGLWIAPFLVSLKSPLGRDHRDWLLRHDDGEPLVELDNAHWGGKTGTLDPTRPEVLDWLRALGERVAHWEFDYVKMDFLVHALTGQASDEAIPRAEAYRGAIRALQAGLGPRVRTMGCGTPLVTGRGLFEAARIDDDVVTDWSLLRSRLSSVAVRAPLHRHWWRNDPDNVLLREPFSLSHGRLWASVVSMSGGNVFLGDDLRKLDEDRWEVARKIWPPVEIESKPLGLMNPALPSECPAGEGWVAHAERPWGGMRMVSLINWEDKPRDRYVSWIDLGIDIHQRCHVWELWTETHRGIAVEEMQSRLAAQSCEVLAITPISDRPQIIGSTRHVLIGAVGIEDVVWDPKEAILRGVTTHHLPNAVSRLVVAAPSLWRRVEALGVVLEETSVDDEHMLFTLRVDGNGAWALRFS